MLKVWNVSLVLATGTLAIMGTFLVRSGVLNSIHAFGGATLGVPFVCLIAVLIVGSIYLVVTRRDMLRSEHRLDSLLSRESIFLMNNIVLVGLCFVIFWGTYFPLISEALTGKESSVGPPWFDRYTVPLALDPGPAQRDRAGDRLAPGDAGERTSQLPETGAGGPDHAGVLSSRASVTSRWLWRCSAAGRSCSPAWARSSSAGPARGARWPASLRPSRCSRWCGATGAAMAAISCTSASPFSSSASPPRRPSSIQASSAAPGPVDPRRRLHRALRAADRLGHAEVRPRAHRLDARRSAPKWTSPRTATTSPL